MYHELNRAVLRASVFDSMKEEHMEAEQRGCRLCGQGPVTICYEGPIRSGSFGKITDEDFKVLSCSDCEVAYLAPFPLVDYDSGSYREAYDDSAWIRDYFLKHDKEQIFTMFALLNDVSFRDKVVGDFGCGGGVPRPCPWFGDGDGCH